MSNVADALVDIAKDKAKNRRDLNKWWINNASAKHGVPWTEDNEPLKVIHTHHHEPPIEKIVEKPVEVEKIVEKIVEKPVPAVVEKPFPAKSKMPEWLKWTGGALTGAALGTGGYLLGTSGEEKVEQPPVVEERVEDSSSLFQYLEDQGRHIPEENRK